MEPSANPSEPPVSGAPSHSRLASGSPSWGLRMGAMAGWGLRLSVWGAPAFAALGACLLTLSVDEGWILGSVRGLAEHGRFGAGATMVVTHSTGGLHTALATLLHWVSGGQLQILRSLSVIALAGFLILLGRWARRVFGAGLAPYVVAGAPLAVPGTFVLAGQAYGAVLATLTAMIGYAVWGEARAGSWTRRILVGLVLGTAAATRMNLLPGLAVPLLCALLGARAERRVQAVDALWAFAGAVATFAVGYGALWALSVNVLMTPEARESYGMSLGILEPLAYVIPRRLWFWGVSQSFLPFALMGVISVAWWSIRKRVSAWRVVDAVLVFAWVLWLAWLVQAPIPHLRYLWPSLVAFALVGSVCLVGWLGATESGPVPRFPALLVCVSGLAVIGGYVDGIRAYLNSDSDAISWEWSREARYSTQHGPLRAIRSQYAITQRIQAIPASDTVVTLTIDSALAFISRRPIAPITEYYADQESALVAQRLRGTPRWLIITPIVNRWIGTQLTPRLALWIEKNCRLDAQYGPYVLYEITGTMPAQSAVFRLDEWEPALPLTRARHSL